MEDGEDWEEYSMAALPRHSSLFIKSIDKGRPKAFYKSLLQVVGNSKTKVINLDSASMTEEVAMAIILS